MPLDNEGQARLFELPTGEDQRAQVGRPEYPLWTERKATLIRRYLFRFLMVTRHGVYIDGFAGPQRPSLPDTWSARLVLHMEPRWLRHFYLFDADSRQAQWLRLLRAEHPEPGRITVFEGDFNARVDEILRAEHIRQHEATFCLLDQRMAECWWATLEKLAAYAAREDYKIELFYFLANRWLPRAIATADHGSSKYAAWWGRSDWKKLEHTASLERAALVRDRFEQELGYRFVTPWPIYSREAQGGYVAYYMIHASDHPRAPKLMESAYHEVVGAPPESPEQTTLFD